MTKVELKEGMKAPDFQAASSEGGEIALKDLAGKTVVLYFYPKDSTPGCTKEACGFRDVNAELRELGVVVLGVSKDSLKSHGKFAEKHGLNFPLLSDPEGKILDAYGAWKEKTIYGRTALGIERSTFLIDGDGVIRRVWRKVKVAGHVEEVVEAVKELG